jgi:hypothetical protein
MLNLKNAELVIVGGLTAELEPYLRDFNSPSVRLTGFVEDVAAELGKPPRLSSRRVSAALS